MPTTTRSTDQPPVVIAGAFDASDPVVLGANPLVGLNRRQATAALGRLLQQVAVEPGVAAATTLGAAGELMAVLVGRSDVAPDPRDRRFADPAWRTNPIYRRLLQAYLVEARALQRTGRTDDAITAATAARDLAPGYYMTHHELGMILMSARRNADARPELEKYLELAPNDKDADTVRQLLSAPAP